MKKRQLFLTLASLCLLVGCGKGAADSPPNTDSGTEQVPDQGGQDTQEDNKDTETDSNKPDSEDGETEVLPPIPEGDVDVETIKNFEGEYHYKDKTIEITKEGQISLTGVETLVPTKTKTGLFNVNGELVELDAIYFAKPHNARDLRVRFSGTGIYRLLVEEKINNKYVLLYEMQPGCPEAVGMYNFMGDNGEYNTNYHFTNEFNPYTNEFRGTQTSASGKVYDEQTITFKTYCIDLEGERTVGIEMYHGGDIFGSYTPMVSQSVPGLGLLYDLQYPDSSLLTDASLLLHQYFKEDGTTLKFTPNFEEKTVLIDAKPYTYECGMDERGQLITLKATDETIILRPELYGISITTSAGSTHAAYDSLFELRDKTFKNDKISVLIEPTSTGHTLTLNGVAETPFTYCMEGGRKAIKFTHEGTEYIVSPFKFGVSALVRVGDEVSYLVNEEEYLSLFTGKSFISVNKGVTTSYAISETGEVKHAETSVQGMLTYDPIVSAEPVYQFKIDEKSYVMSYESCETLMVKVESKDETSYYFDKTIVESLYDEYTSHHEVELIWTAEKVSYFSKDMEYSLRPIKLRDSTLMGLILHDGDKEIVFEAYSHHTLSERIADKPNRSYISIESFKKLEGTYVFDGIYGPERFIISADGHFKADTPNATKTGLDLIEYPYQLTEYKKLGGIVQTCITFYSESLDVTIYLYKDTFGLICFGELYVQENLYRNKGVYTNEGVTSVVHLEDDVIKIDGNDIYLKTVSEEEGKVVATGNDGTVVTFETVGEIQKATVVKAGTTTEYTLTDFDPASLLGVYSKPDAAQKIEFVEVVDEISGVVLGYRLIVGTTALEGKVVVHNGHIALKFSTFNEDYYIYNDGTENKMDIVAGLLPPPPLPPGPPIPPPPPLPPAPPAPPLP